MIEVGVFHNGASDLPVTYRGGIALNDGSLKDAHEAARRTILNQVRRREADAHRCAFIQGAAGILVFLVMTLLTLRGSSEMASTSQVFTISPRRKS